MNFSPFKAVFGFSNSSATCGGLLDCRLSVGKVNTMNNYLLNRNIQ